jgi:hypothetical protein
MLEDTSINQEQYSIILIMKQVFYLVGSLYYQKHFQKSEPRSIVCLSCCLYILYSGMMFSFSMRWNLTIGIPDFIFVIVYEGIVQAIADTLLFISMSAFFAKLVPNLIEGSSFALYSGTFRFTYGIISPFLAIFVN